MSRKRPTLDSEGELQTMQRLSTKKELADKEKRPLCPVPVKLRKNLRCKHQKELAPLCFNNNVTLSPLYNPEMRTSYFEQMYVKLGHIGEGSFGMVYKVRSKEDKKLYAVKRIKTHISTKDRSAEVKNNEMVGYNPYCVEYFMAWEEKFDTFMLLEYCDMSLADYAKVNNEIPEALLWNVLHDICNAFDYLHNKSFLHLDVKPGNIMMKKGLFKLGDFGLLVDLNSNNKIKKSTLSEGDSKYLAVEVLDAIYTFACDIFGLGISLLELATDIELPQHGVLWHALRSDHIPEVFNNRVSKSMEKIIREMIAKDYKIRPSAVKILHHPKLRAITKQDKKDYARVDYVAQLLKTDNQKNNLPLSPIQMNKNSNTVVSTPPFNTSSPFTGSPIMLEDDAKQCISKCKKSLFSRSEGDFSDSINFSFSLDSCKKDSMQDSGMDCDSFITSSRICSPDHVSLENSTPVVTPEQGRRIPKVKLNFC